jgi:hypothetical protein
MSSMFGYSDSRFTAGERVRADDLLVGSTPREVLP